MSDLILRSVMFVPAHDTKLLMKAVRTIADAIIPDIEDSVQPRSVKPIARKNIVDLCKKGVFSSKKTFPRINDDESGLLLEDLNALTVDGIDGFVYPKPRCKEDIFFIDKLLACLELEKGFPVGKFKLIPLIETSSAVINIDEICVASQRIVAVAFGCEDFLTDLGGDKGPDLNTLNMPRALIALAAKSAGVIPIDTVHVNVHDLIDLETNLTLAKSMGFEGMLVLHPKELELVHRYFSPSTEEVEHSHRILALAKEAESRDRGVAIISGTFVGPPMIKKAHKIIQRYNAIKRLTV
ncbi:CoA ester lyase [Rhodobacterales bacterium LSUCC0246]|nr:CoA ester lyase [Rhodobacterales bacterium LSUCC0374]